MGVTGLWPLLSELAEKKPLSYLNGKRVAVDLSGWVVEAARCNGLKTAKNPHLRNLFFRVSRLLRNGAHPVFILEGNAPFLKGDAIKQRQPHPHKHFSNSEHVSRGMFDRVLEQVVDGVITEDNDAFLYGANVVFRDFSIDPNDSHVNLYRLNSSRNKLHLNQRKLVALALLLGCDYFKGVPGIGKDAAVKLLFELQDTDILQRFKDWKQLSESDLFPGYDSKPLKKSTHCSRCNHTGSSSKHKKEGCEMCESKITCYLPDVSKPCTCSWHKKNEIELKRKTELKIYNIVKKMGNFPDLKVIDEYLNYSDEIPEEENLEWKCPNLDEFQDKVLTYLNWTLESSFKKFLPIFTSWQQLKITKKQECNKINLSFEPVRILKEHTIKSEDYYEVLWRESGAKICKVEMPEEIMSTYEFTERFAKAYPEIVRTFKEKCEEEKEKKKEKSKTKRVVSANDNFKVKPEPVLKLTDTLYTPVKSIFQNQHNASNNNVENLSPSCSSSFKLQNKENDSFDSFLDVPLYERIKLLSVNLTKQKQSQKHSLTKSEDLTSNTSYVKGHVLNTLVDASSKNNPENSKCLEFEDSDDSFLEILKSQETHFLKFNSNVKRKSVICNSVQNEYHCATPLGNKTSSLHNYNIDSKSKIFLTHSPQNSAKSSHFLEFNDTDDSFLDILNSQQQFYIKSNSKICNSSYIHTANDSKCHIGYDRDVIRKGQAGSLKEPNSVRKYWLCDFSNSQKNESPKLLYSLSQKPSNSKNILKHNPLLCNQVLNSTPSLRLNEMTPKKISFKLNISSSPNIFQASLLASPAALQGNLLTSPTTFQCNISNVIYSPLIFESSNDLTDSFF
ncbi:flap endonuclease GEN-like isoform X2 [Stegodyphus dumicola]|uniref:flap endonuclease GEN-like isoform X2 n=1 Tax=Stegodyphus dumicola TaxID=202533 RepID=UPI0015AB402C|nr:flap endonuclease GEN-like isoform X2 [Stegodyphus dumicola]